MQESNFEKQVQQKLDELQLTPSEPVWQNIEVAIRKKKDRRLVFWMCSVLLLAGGVVWWQVATAPAHQIAKQPAAKNQTQETFSEPHAPKQDQNTANVNQSTSSNNNHEPYSNTEVITQEPVQQRDSKIAETPKQANPAQPSTKKQKHAYDQIEKAGRKMTSQQIVATKPVKTKAVTRNNPTAETTIKEATAPNAVEPHATEPTRAAGETNNPVTATGSAQQQKTTVADSVAKPVPQLQKKTGTAKRLQWSIAGHIGASKVVTSLANSFGRKANATSYPQAGYSSWVPRSSDSGYKQPAAPTPGIQYAIGVQLKKGIGKKSFIRTGLQYSYYSYHLAVGTEPVENSLINRNRLAVQNTYLNNSKQNQFTNTLQFLELPVGFEYQLLKRLPLHIQHGITINKLLSGKVLQYDYASNTYNQNSDGLRKTGIGLFTVVDYTIWKGTAASLQAGPHVQYGLQPLFKNSQESHLLSGGLALTMSF